MTAITERKVQVLPKQSEFIHSHTKEVMYCGGFGSGKSRALCYKIALHASIPGNLVGLCRKTRTSLVKTTLRTLLQPEGDLPPVLPPEVYTHHESKSLITLHGGGQIVYFGFDDPSSVASMNLGCCGVDEVVEIDEDEYTMLLGRCRLPVDPYRSVFSATNPGNPSHFLHTRFYRDNPIVAKRGTQIQRKRTLIVSGSDDNVFLPADYLETLNELTGARKLRYVKGLWVGFEGLVYGDQWNRSVHMQHRDGPWVDYVYGVDEGYTNPAVLLEYGIDSDGRLHLIRMYYERGVLQDDFVALARKWDDGKGAVFCCDPSAAGLIAAMRAAGLNAIPANNDIRTGIAAVQNRLSTKGDSKPRVTYEPDCTHMALEKESYEWDSTKDKPIKEMDHAQDAERYVVNWVDGNRGSPGVSSAPKVKVPLEERLKDKQPVDYSPSEALQKEELWTSPAD